MVLPSAVLAMVIYVWLCNVLSTQKVFYAVTSFFLGFLAIFALVLYPYPHLVHPSAETIAALAESYPNFKWFIKIAGHWSYALFYTMAELWGSMMLSLLFWQFANQVTKMEEAKRFYSMFGLLGNFALPMVTVALTFSYFLSEEVHFIDSHLKFLPVLMITILSGFLTMFCYWWVNAKVLTDPQFQDAGAKTKKKKVKMSLSESFKMIFTSKYLGMIAMLILAYGVSINLVEGVWKAKLRELYPTKEAYSMYMAHFQAWQGIAAIIFMIIGSNILRRVSWKAAALFTPMMMLITGVAFFGFVVFDNVIAMHVTGVLASTPLVMAVTIGLVQNVLSKATKYSLFDSTKEMAYIPLDDEMKSKGKAAVDVVGGRFGKSGGGIIQSTFFMLLPAFTFAEATPYFAVIFFVVVILWMWAVFGLSKQYEAKIGKNTHNKRAAK
jgi:AAA family ATP:ADP antiporter